MKDKFKDAYMKVAETFAGLSTAKKLQVGAIIVKDNRIISIGYNGMPSGWSNECEVEVPEKIDYENQLFQEAELRTKPEVLHAEANAITKLAASSESSQGADLFCTHTPCIECAKLIHQCNIKTVYVRNQYNARKGCGEEFLKKSGINVEYVS